MAEKKPEKTEREYTIPLRKEWQKVAYYKRSFKAVKAIKEFIAKHMKIVDRDVNKVKLDVYLNNEVWYRGKQSPPSKIKVKAIKEGDEVIVTFPEMPSHIKFAKARHDKFNQESKKSDKEKEKAEEKKAGASTETKEEKAEEKKAEVEKEKATEIQHAREAKVKENVQQHTTKVQPAIHPVRQALKK